MFNRLVLLADGKVSDGSRCVIFITRKMINDTIISFQLLSSGSTFCEGQSEIRLS